jgi:hypothetical protein
MTDTSLPVPANTVRSRQVSRTRGGAVFLSLLALATALPWLLLPALDRTAAEGGLSTHAKSMLVFLGSGAHVAASYAFYVDATMRERMRGHRWRYYFVPAIVIGTAVVVFAFGSRRTTATALLLYFVWQTHHYTRQNVGVFAFATRARGTLSASDLERAAITTAGFAGVIGMITFLAPWQDTSLAPVAIHLHGLALLVYVGAVALLLACLPRAWKARDLVRFAFLVGGVVFYLPTFVYGSAFSAIASYAIAHGCQYLVFMGWLATSVRRTKGWRVMGTVAGFALAGGLLLNSLDGLRAGGIAGGLFGLYLGIVMTHFVLDAGVWRLSDPEQRKYMAERFEFLS